jgi:hypothetical protein
MGLFCGGVGCVAGSVVVGGVVVCVCVCVNLTSSEGGLP